MDCISSALHDGQIQSTDINYIETHGTGTALGDPIEMRALQSVYGNRKSDVNNVEDALVIGSVKSNIGHL